MRLFFHCHIINAYKEVIGTKSWNDQLCVYVSVCRGGGIAWLLVAMQLCPCRDPAESPCYFTHYIRGDGLQVKSSLPHCFTVEMGRDAFTYSYFIIMYIHGYNSTFWPQQQCYKFNFCYQFKLWTAELFVYHNQCMFWGERGERGRERLTPVECSSRAGSSEADMLWFPWVFSSVLLKVWLPSRPARALVLLPTDDCLCLDASCKPISSS